MQKKVQIKTRGFATIFKKAALQFVLRWLREHNSKLRVHESWIREIEFTAACPMAWRHLWKDGFLDCYSSQPDLTPALLNFLRQKWGHLEKSKAGRLKKFLSANTCAKWDDSFASLAAVEEANKIRRILKEKDNRPKVPPGGRAVMKEDLEFLELSRTMWAKRKHHNAVVPDEFGNVSMWDLQDGEIAVAFEKSPGGSRVEIADVVKARKWVAANQLASEQFAEEVLDKDGFLQVKASPRRRK